MTQWDRGYFHGAIAEATGIVLWTDAPAIDALIAKAQELGLQPDDLKVWIYTELARITMELRLTAITGALEQWAAKRRKPTPAACGHCGEPVEDPGAHECNGRGGPQP